MAFVAEASLNPHHHHHAAVQSDLTSRLRQYICEEGGGDALIRVDEPETCRYVLTVRTARVCAHRALAPPPSRRPQPLTCRPALSEQQMQRLAQARLERARRDAERAARWTAERQRHEEEEEQEQEQEREEMIEEERRDEQEMRKQDERKTAAIGDKGTAYLVKGEFAADDEGGWPVFCDKASEVLKHQHIIYTLFPR